MSQDIDTIHTIVGRWNAGDRDAAAVVEYFDPAIELVSPFSSVVGEPYRGHGGVEQWMRDVDEQFDEWHLRLEDVRQVSDAVIGIGSVNGRGRASGIPFEFSAAMIAHFASGRRIARLQIYLDVSEALEAVGLTE